MLLKKMRWMSIALLAVFLLTTSIASNAEIFSYQTPISGTSTPSAFDKRFVTFMRHWRVPGASVAIMRNDQLVFAHGYGWANAETRQPVTPDSLFRVGSVSKAITAITILKLVEEGRLKLDDKAFLLLSDLRPLNNRHNPGIYQITVRNLLQMASGWQTNAIDPMFGPWSVHMLTQLGDYNHEVPPDCETAARLMMGMPLHSKPGTQFSYSNINYCLLGLLTNKATNVPYSYQNYEAYVQQNILAPLGIIDMHIGDTLFQNRAPNEVKYYTYPGFTSPDSSDLMTTLAKVDGLPYSNSQILKKNFADGGWVASATDLAKLLQALGNRRIISSRLINVMTSKPTYKTHSKENYFAMGWSIKRINNGFYWVKTGSFTGTYAVVIQGQNNTSYVALFNIKPSPRTTFLAQLQRILITGV